MNDAEQTIMREVDEVGSEIKAIGATRDMCEGCQNVATKRGDIDKVVTPLKE